MKFIAIWCVFIAFQRLYVITTCVCVPLRARVSLVLCWCHMRHMQPYVVSVVVTADRGFEAQVCCVQATTTLRTLHTCSPRLSDSFLSFSRVSISAQRAFARACHVQPQSLERAKCTAPFVLIDLLSWKKVEINTLQVCASCVKMCPLIHTTAGEPP